MAYNTWNITNVNNLFKIKYGKLSENVYNSANVLLGRVKKSYDFTGRQKFIPVPQSFTGGVGSGSLPTANFAKYEDAILTRKKVYGRILLDREAIHASADDEGSFVRATKHQISKVVESYMRNMSRILFNDGTGLLGVVSSVVDNGGGNYSLVITNASWKEANWEEQDGVNIETGNTDLFTVESVTPSTKTIVVQRRTGSQVPVATDSIFMQGSENNDPQGLKGVLDATSGSLYTVPVGRRWQSVQLDAGGAGLTADLLNQQVLELTRRSGKTPNLIIMSYVQYRKLLNFLEDQKQYIVEPRSPDLKGVVSFKGVEYLSSAGAIPIFPERFLEDDRVYLLNDNFIEIHHAPGFGWFDDDGTVLLRSADNDSYEARYGGYMECYIVPPFQAEITNLAV